ncbi:MAG: rhodanese-like domain-containing protein [Coriobacteriia bacterium]|jgi:rhodanese-related sulfurtransferase
MNRAKSIVLVLGALLIAGVVIALGSSGGDGGLVDNAEMRALMDDGVRLVDVRTAAEFEAGHLPGAELVPLNTFEAAAAGWDPSEPIVLYCATGSRSSQAAAVLRGLGFKTVYDLGGGIVQWDGEVLGGAAVAATPVPAAVGGAVMYEFYTDW